MLGSWSEGTACRCRVRGAGAATRCFLPRMPCRPEPAPLHSHALSVSPHASPVLPSTAMPKYMPGRCQELLEPAVRGHGVHACRRACGGAAGGQAGAVRACMRARARGRAPPTLVVPSGCPEQRHAARQHPVGHAHVAHCRAQAQAQQEQATPCAEPVCAPRLWPVAGVAVASTQRAAALLTDLHERGVGVDDRVLRLLQHHLVPDLWGVEVVGHIRPDHGGGPCSARAGPRANGVRDPGDLPVNSVSGKAWESWNGLEVTPQEGLDGQAPGGGSKHRGKGGCAVAAAPRCWQGSAASSPPAPPFPCCCVGCGVMYARTHGVQREQPQAVDASTPREEERARSSAFNSGTRACIRTLTPHCCCSATALAGPQAGAVCGAWGGVGGGTAHSNQLCSTMSARNASPLLKWALQAGRSFASGAPEGPARKVGQLAAA